jgi:hypothetical protein
VLDLFCVGESHGAAVTLRLMRSLMAMLEDQRKIGMSFLHAYLTMLLTAFFLS